MTFGSGMRLSYRQNAELLHGGGFAFTKEFADSHNERPDRWRPI